MRSEKHGSASEVGKKLMTKRGLSFPMGGGAGAASGDSLGLGELVPGSPPGTGKALLCSPFPGRSCPRSWVMREKKQ